ncbi:MAG: DJ-1/PfpI family protein [Lachnospiraceae bacterium]|nr:DJ-1/PfpI family protein [Lachnospiraceae bacterium]
MSKAAIFLADGFETIEGLTVVDLCRRAGVDLVTVSVTDSKRVVTAHRIPLETDLTISELDFDSLDMIILPGGIPGTPNLEACDQLMQQLNAFYEAGRYISAICAAPRIFGKRGYLKGRKATCFPGVESFLEGADYTGSKLEVADHLITSRGMGTATEFALAIVERLEGADKAKEIASQVTFEGWK